MSGVIQREPLRTYVLLEVLHRFPIRDGIGHECARRLWSHDDVVRVEPLADSPTLSDMVAAIEKLPASKVTP